MRDVIAGCWIAIVLIPMILFAQVENWVYNYNGPVNGNDGAWSITYGDDGNIYAAGFSAVTGNNKFIVISFSPSGDTNWTFKSPSSSSEIGEARDIIFGPGGCVYAAGRITNEFVVVSLDTSGDSNWVYRYSGPGTWTNEAQSLEYGLDGNIYAGGWTARTGGSSSDFAVISLTPAGDTNWTYIHPPQATGYDQVSSLVFGADSNIYVAGGINNSAGNLDFSVVCLTHDGNVDWIYQLNGSMNNFDIANAISYGADGNIYAAGQIRLGTSNFDLVVVSLSSVGDTNWVYSYDGSAHSFDWAHAITYGQDGNIYVAGSVDEGNSTDIAVLCLDTSGDTNWVYRYDGTEHLSDGGEAIAYGLDGNIYVAGVSQETPYGPEFTIISIDASGNENWIYTYHEQAIDNADLCSDVVFGLDGNVYAAGYSTDSSYNEDFVVVSLGVTGIEEEFSKGKKSGMVNSTILSGPLQLPKDAKCRVFDIAGREADAVHLSPGVYFVEIDGSVQQKIVKIR
jgi:uncharacterized delta-60 repeat protein